MHMSSALSAVLQLRRVRLVPVVVVAPPPTTALPGLIVPLLDLLVFALPQDLKTGKEIIKIPLDYRLNHH